MNKKEMYENQRNFCSEFMKCFLDSYCDSTTKLNKEFSKFVIENIEKTIEKNKRKK